MLTVPHVSVAAFKAAPTFLDLDNLRVGDTTLADQDAELLNILLRASSWADSFARQPLAGHTVTAERGRGRTDRWGRVKTPLAHGPARRLTAFAYGTSPTALTTLSDLSGAWLETTTGGTQSSLVMPLSGPNSGPWSGSLQFGGPVPGAELYLQLGYEAGYANPTVAQAQQGATSLQVTSTAAIQPGDTLRLMDPGAEEAVTVDPSYTVGSTTVPLTGALLHPHNAGVQLTALPGDVMQAVIFYATALLLRPDTSAEDPFADAQLEPTTRKADPRKDGSGLVLEATRLLKPFRPVR